LLVFSCNFEPICAIVLIISILLAIYKRNKFVCSMLGISIASFIFHITCPGNYIRLGESSEIYDTYYAILFFSIYEEIYCVLLLCAVILFCGFFTRHKCVFLLPLIVPFYYLYGAYYDFYIVSRYHFVFFVFFFGTIASLILILGKSKRAFLCIALFCAAFIMPSVNLILANYISDSFSTLITSFYYIGIAVTVFDTTHKKCPDVWGISCSRYVIPLSRYRHCRYQGLVEAIEEAT
jgi:hypothetical protein